jgi:hypothetical protein
MVQIGGLTKLGSSTVLSYPFVQSLRINRDMTTASGTVAYTGVGFTPRAIKCFGAIQNADSLNWGVTTVAGSFQNDMLYVSSEGAGDFTRSGQNLIRNFTSVSDGQTAVLDSFDSDGFTLTWTKAGSPTGSLAVMMLAIA